MRKCLFCDHELSADDKEKCPECKRELGDPKFCNTCQRRMPPGADVCNVCKSYQKWWNRWLFQAATMATQAVALVAILSNIFLVRSLLDSESHTRFKVAHADDERIYLKVWNSGKKPSALLAYRLNFGTLPIAPADLLLDAGDGREAKNILKPDDLVMLSLTIGTITLYPPGKPEAPYPKQKALDLLRGRNVTLEIDILESNDPGTFFKRSFHTWSDTFPETVVHRFIEVGLQ